MKGWGIQTRILGVWAGSLMGRHQNVGGLGWRAGGQAPECWFVLEGCWAGSIMLGVCWAGTRMVVDWDEGVVGRHQNIKRFGLEG